MIRSLVIRQTFLVFDAALVVLALATGLMILLKFIEAPVMAPPPPAAAEVSDVETLHQVAERTAYNPIVDTYQMFGEAGAYDPARVPTVTEEKPPEPEGEEPVSVPLRLVGTTATKSMASAIIEDTSQPGSAHSYYIGQMVVDQVTLEEVYARYVIVRNKQNGENKRERLSMDDESQKATQQAVAKPTPAPAAPNGNARMTLKRQEIMNDLQNNYQELIKIKPELSRDANGKVVGLTANNIGNIPLAKKMGLQDGDVLQTVNNEPIDSEAKVMEMISKYQNSNSFRIGLMRNGKPQVVTFRLE